MTSFKEGDAVSITFPESLAGVSYVGVVERVRDDAKFGEYTYLVVWTQDGRELRRLCCGAWLKKASFLARLTASKAKLASAGP